MNSFPKEMVKFIRDQFGTNDYIPLHNPHFEGREKEYLLDTIDSNFVSTVGEYVSKFEEMVARYTGAKYAIATVNGTSALQVSIRLAGVVRGDEVIMPTLTFISPANAIAYNGATPIFMDADEYYNIDSEKTIEFIKNETVFKKGYCYNRLLYC